MDRRSLDHQLTALLSPLAWRVGVRRLALLVLPVSVAIVLLGAIAILALQLALEAMSLVRRLWHAPRKRLHSRHSYYSGYAPRRKRMRSEKPSPLFDPSPAD